MTDMPYWLRRAIVAQGKVDPDEILEKLDDVDPEALLGVVYPEEPRQEILEVGSVEPDVHA